MKYNFYRGLISALKYIALQGIVRIQVGLPEVVFLTSN